MFCPCLEEEYEGEIESTKELQFRVLRGEDDETLWESLRGDIDDKADGKFLNIF